MQKRRGGGLVSRGVGTSQEMVHGSGMAGSWARPGIELDRMPLQVAGLLVE